MNKLLLFLLSIIFLLNLNLLFGDDVPNSPWNAVDIKCGKYSYNLETAEDMDFFKFKIEKDTTILFKFSSSCEDCDSYSEYTVKIELRKYSEDYSSYKKIDYWTDDDISEEYINLKKGLYAFVFYPYYKSSFKKEINYTFEIDSPTCENLGGNTTTAENNQSQGENSPNNDSSYEKGYKAGIEFCKNNPDKCGLPSDCKNEYEKGYNEGIEYCKQNPDKCGISACENSPESNPFISPNIDSSCGYYNFMTSALHVPCIKIGDDKFWFDFKVEIDKYNNVYLTIGNYGKTYSEVDCSKFDEDTCKKYNDMCIWEPGIFGVTGKCKSK